jgi:acetoin utilization protein AcuC
MPDTTAVFIHSDDIERFHYPAGCPFKTERAGRTRSILKSMDLYESGGCSETAPRPATMDELRLFHTADYCSALQRVSRGNITSHDLFMGIGTQDTPIFADLFAYATLAAGGTIHGAELILKNKTLIAFNPSGGYHHAMPGAAGGFCYINDVVLGCMTLARNNRKVLCLDLDAHHGNGTQAAFYTDPSVFTISFHESGTTLFPWGGFENEIGEGKGLGYNVNIPLPAGTDDEAFSFAFQQIVPPLLDAYRPDVLVLEIGMDILSLDPLTHLNMTNNAIADTLPLLVNRGLPILAVGGGGYNPEHTARGWALAWTIFCKNEPDADMSIGMGGMFLGNAEWSAGLRDGKIYARGEEKAAVKNQVEETVEKIKKTVFPLHGL